MQLVRGDICQPHRAEASGARGREARLFPRLCCASTRRGSCSLGPLSERQLRVRPSSPAPTTSSAPMSYLGMPLSGPFATARWLPSFQSQLGAMFSLLPGWDTYNGKPITAESAEAAVGFMTRFLEPKTTAPWIVPLADGGLQLEWHENGVDLEVAFPATDNPELYALDLTTGEEITADPRNADPADLEH